MLPEEPGTPWREWTSRETRPGRHEPRRHRRNLTAGILALILPAFALRWPARAFDAARAVPAEAGGPVTDVRADALSPACHAGMALGAAAMFVLPL
ncbi:DUF5134 domain-containing protein [Streptomyces gilvus]|uniref:DUF5134 domain-containing protein n=1 Tax=Streptomyces gilvus TaxID=2920937 RepID=UPI0035A86333